MKRIVLKFGMIAGGLLAAMMVVTFPLYNKGILDYSSGEILGYTSIVLSFLLVFFGIRSYRETVGDGVITFGRAFGVGLLITLVTCVVYVATWQVLYFGFGGNDFVEQYSSTALAEMRDSGATESAIESKRSELAKFAQMYDEPWFNIAITFMEVFPIGLIMTLVSAGILRRADVAPTATGVTA